MSSRTGGVTTGAGTRSLAAWRWASAILLLVMGGIHLYLVLFSGFDGLVGTLFVINAIGALVLAIAMVAVPDRLLTLTSLLSLLFTAGTLLALVLSLTLPGGFLGVREQISAELVPTTLVAEALGTLVLLGTTLMAARPRRS